MKEDVRVLFNSRRPGLALRCQINGENLECILTLPRKYERRIEGLAGNFDDNPSNDLVNRNTTQVVQLNPTNGMSNEQIDRSVLAACQTCQFRTNVTDREKILIDLF
jgi:hypothetical protein